MPETKSARHRAREGKQPRVVGQTRVVGKFGTTDTIRRLDEKRPLLRPHRECLYSRFTSEERSSLSPLGETSLFRRGFSLSLSDSSRSAPLFARYLARWPPAQPMKARGGELLRCSYGMAGVAEGWGSAASATFLLFQPPQPGPPHPNLPPNPPGNHPGRATILRHLTPSTPAAGWRYRSSPSLLPPRTLAPCPARARESARTPPTALCLEF